jgi:hypothetical protein
MFDVCQAKGSQDIEWSVYPSVQFDPGSFDLKINMVHLFFIMYQCTKFVVHQAKGSQDIEWSVHSYIQFDL